MQVSPRKSGSAKGRSSTAERVRGTKRDCSPSDLLTPNVPLGSGCGQRVYTGLPLTWYVRRSPPLASVAGHRTPPELPMGWIADSSSLLGGTGGGAQALRHLSGGHAKPRMSDREGQLPWRPWPSWRSAVAKDQGRTYVRICVAAQTKATQTDTTQVPPSP